MSDDPFDDDRLLLPAGADPEPLREPKPTNKFRDMHHFVTEYLVVVWARTMRETDHGFRWCPHWQQHPAAVERLTALWQAYEVLHCEGGLGPSQWWTHHADPHYAALTASDGPFARCGPLRHQPAAALPTA